MSISYFYYLLIIVYTFIYSIGLTKESRAQYVDRMIDYDSHPYPAGWPEEKKHAETICKRYDKRFCSTSDLAKYVYIQKRDYCIPTWIYHTKYKEKIAVVINPTGRNCLNLDRKKQKKIMKYYEGILPFTNTYLQYKSFTDYYYYVCLYSKSQTQMEYDCEGNGDNYQGTKSVTKSGKICQNWFIDYPNKVLGDKRKAKLNYCRNIDNSVRPWCYYADSVGREDCDLNCSPYGNFVECRLDMYERIKFRGNICSVLVGQGEYKYVNKEEVCGEGKRISSLKVSGSFCYVTLFNNITNDFHILKPNIIINETYKKISETLLRHKGIIIKIYDTSSDVIIGNFPLLLNEEKKTFFPNLHYCDISEIENASTIISINKTIPYGIVDDTKKSVKYMYYPGQFYPYNKKKTWCCLDEHPTLDNRYTFKEDAFSLCSSMTQNRTITNRGKKHTITHFKRVCTKGDLLSHFGSFKRNAPYGWIAISKSQIELYMINKNGQLQKGDSTQITKAKTWCCDEDCLPSEYPCKTDKDCCELNCFKNICYPPDYDKNKTILYEIKKSQIPTWAKYLIGVSTIYLTGWLMRCCCPQRRMASRHVRMP